MALLSVSQVSVRFGGIVAVQDVDLDVEAASITGLIGPNGAGKTTLFNVITGLQETVGGRVFLDGDDITALKPHQRARRGLARTFQRLEVFGSLSARENVQVAAEIKGTGDRSARDIALELLERVGIADVAENRVDAMPTGLARLVELARALATQPRVLLLDEPGSGLDESETESFAELLGELAAGGLGILIVEHDVELVMRICQRIHVLDFGRIIAVGTPKDIQRNRAVQEAYLGQTDSADDAA